MIVVQVVFFILAGGSLFGLTGYLFRDEITGGRWFKA